MAKLSREAFLARFSGQAIDLTKLRDLPTEVRERVIRADRNKDGKISGRRELDALFTRLDELDRNGSYHSIDVTNSRAPTPLGRTVTALSEAADHKPNPGVRVRQERKAPRRRSLRDLVGSNPSLKTNQDLINHFLRAGGRVWGRSQQIARSYGLDLNQLVKKRSAQIFPPAVPLPDTPGTPPVSTRSAATPPANTNPTPTTTQPVTVAPAASDEPRVVPSGRLGAAYGDNERDAGRAQLRLTRNHQNDIRRFQRVYEQNRQRYQTVSRATGIPPQLIAAIHYRESSMNFGTYLHQGDPLGRPAVHHPRNIPVFSRWEDAAIHALQQKGSVRRALGINANTTNPAALATFAERYNGLGYHNRGLPSPYAWSGTNIYQGGRYVRDHVYDANSWDRRPGVMALMASLNGTELGQGVANQTPEEAWAQVRAGNERLRRGVRSEAVTFLQSMLQGLGYDIQVDGDYGKNTKAAVRAFQRARNLTVDGVVGPTTAASLAEAFEAL